MSVVSAKNMLLRASQERYSVGAFNITNIIQMEAVVEAAISKMAPLIIQTSVTPAKFLRPEVVSSVYRTLAEAAPIPICLHLDHCTDVEFCKRCADSGYTNIMIDGSKNDFEKNIKITKEVSDYCHMREDISVEGELGTVCGVEDQVVVVESETELCEPSKTMEFVERTDVDIFAPAIGTAHGVYKTENPKIDFNRLEEINNIINGQEIRVPLVVHGGTGLKPEVTKKLVSLGGAKFNVSTDLKHTLIDTTYDYINEHRNEYDPGKLDKTTKKAIMDRISWWIDLLGCEGKALSN